MSEGFSSKTGFLPSNFPHPFLHFCTFFSKWEEFIDNMICSDVLYYHFSFTTLVMWESDTNHGPGIIVKTSILIGNFSSLVCMVSVTANIYNCHEPRKVSRCHLTDFRECLNRVSSHRFLLLYSLCPLSCLF